MNAVKPLAALCLLGLVSLAGCGGKDTVEESELQPSEPRQAERERIVAELEKTGSPSKEYPICRNLRPGDPWYPSYIYCCDNGSGTQSFWTGDKGNASGTFNGSCYSWGIR